MLSSLSFGWTQISALMNTLASFSSAIKAATELSMLYEKEYAEERKTRLAAAIAAKQLAEEEEAEALRKPGIPPSFSYSSFGISGSGGSSSQGLGLPPQDAFASMNAALGVVGTPKEANPLSFCRCVNM